MRCRFKGKDIGMPIDKIYFVVSTGPDSAVAKSPANVLVGTGFASRYWLQPRAGL